MERDRSWKRADYPNRPPAWQKIKIPKDPLEGWSKLGGFSIGGVLETETAAKMAAKGLKARGAKKTKIKKEGRFFDVYYKKQGVIKNGNYQSRCNEKQSAETFRDEKSSLQLYVVYGCGYC